MKMTIQEERLDLVLQEDGHGNPLVEGPGQTFVLYTERGSDVSKGTVRASARSGYVSLDIWEGEYAGLTLRIPLLKMAMQAGMVFPLDA